MILYILFVFIRIVTFFKILILLTVDDRENFDSFVHFIQILFSPHFHSLFNLHSSCLKCKISKHIKKFIKEHRW